MRFALNSVVINGEQTLYGTGTCALDMTAIGVAQNQILGWGDASIDMGGTANGKIGVGTSGSAALSLLGMAAAGNLGVNSTGAAALVLTASHGNPDPQIIPASFSSAHPSRRLLVEARPGPVDTE